MDNPVAKARPSCPVAPVRRIFITRQWAEPGRDQAFVIVLIPGGPGRDQAERDFSHLGFALDSEAAVDAVADLGRHAGCLIWEPRREPYPVGYYCGLKDPDGNVAEFSYGQPLGPGAEEAERP